MRVISVHRIPSEWELWNNIWKEQTSKVSKQSKDWTYMWPVDCKTQSATNSWLQIDPADCKATKIPNKRRVMIEGLEKHIKEKKMMSNREIYHKKVYGTKTAPNKSEQEMAMKYCGRKTARNNRGGRSSQKEVVKREKEDKESAFEKGYKDMVRMKYCGIRWPGAIGHDTITRKIGDKWRLWKWRQKWRPGNGDEKLEAENWWGRKDDWQFVINMSWSMNVEKSLRTKKQWAMSASQEMVRKNMTNELCWSNGNGEMEKNKQWEWKGHEEMDIKTWRGGTMWNKGQKNSQGWNDYK